MHSNYWNTVKHRFLSLTNTAIQTAAPVISDAAITLILEKSCLLIEEKLKSIYKKTAINSVITLLLNIIGVLLLIYKPFASKANFYLSTTLFLISFMLFLYRTIRFIKENGATIIELIKNTYKERSFYKGTEQFILNSFPVISLIYTGISIGENYIPYLKKIPKVSSFVKFYVMYFWKQIALFTGTLFIYTILIFWIIKPIILKHFI